MFLVFAGRRKGHARHRRGHRIEEAEQQQPGEKS
jgi:hypothetical protein